LIGWVDEHTFFVDKAGLSGDRAGVQAALDALGTQPPEPNMVELVASVDTTADLWLVGYDLEHVWVEANELGLDGLSMSLRAPAELEAHANLRFPSEPLARNAEETLRTALPGLAQDPDLGPYLRDVSVERRAADLHARLRLTAPLVSQLLERYGDALADWAREQ
jgi:hypothetical protein